MTNRPFDYLQRGIDNIIHSIPDEFKVDIIISRHFRDRLIKRTSNDFGILIDVLTDINFNYPLIIYFSKLDSILPNRGRLESDKFIICGDIINDKFVLRTFYEQ
jgi:hypothetical protein